MEPLAEMEVSGVLVPVPATEEEAPEPDADFFAAYSVHAASASASVRFAYLDRDGGRIMNLRLCRGVRCRDRQD